MGSLRIYASETANDVINKCLMNGSSQYALAAANLKATIFRC
jgi:hypothetical protein